MNIESLKVKLLAPFLVVIVAVALFLSKTLPDRQRDIMMAHQSEVLDQLLSSMVLGVELSLEAENYEGLRSTLDYIEGQEDLFYAAIIQHDQEGIKLIARTPESLSDSSILVPFAFPDEYTVRSEHLKTEALEAELVVAFSNDGLQEEIFNLNKPVYFLILISLLVSGIVYFLIVLRVTTQVTRSVLVAERLSQGEYTFPEYTPTSKSEISRLHAALYKLAKNLLSEKNKNDQLTAQMQQEIADQTMDIRRTQVLLNSVIDTALDAVILASGEGHVKNWNKKAEEIFGYTAEEALNRPLDELIIPEKMRAAHHKGMENYHLTGKGRVLNNVIEVKALRKSGEEFDAELFITPIKQDDEEYFSSFIRDVTEDRAIRREINNQRELIDAILDFIPGKIYLKDERGRFVFINHKMLSAWTEMPIDYQGKTGEELNAPEYLQAIWQNDAGVWADQGSRIEEVRLQNPDGEESYYLVGKSLISVGSTGEHTKYLLSFAYDITSSKLNELELEGALKAKDEFVSTMSHEIRNPLNIIIGLSEILKEQSNDRSANEIISTLIDSSSHLMGLINDILDYAKISSGKLELSHTSVNLQQFLTHLVKQHDRVAKEKGLKLQLIADYTSDKNVQLDELRITQVLANLLSNAFKFTHQGSVSISYALLEESNKEQRVQFKVVDTGIGISSENLDRILAPFTQEHASTSRKYGGSGLGLSIVTRLLQLMGSELEIESEEGKGTCFKFTLDLEKGHPILSEEQSTDRIQQEQFDLNILYVEDMVPNQFIVQSMVSKWGVKLSTASSVDKALEVCNNTLFDLIFMDIQMPGKDGITGFNEIRSTEGTNQQTPIIAFTANAEISEIKRYRNLGFFDVITKPVNSKQLFKFLADFCNQ